MGKVSKALNKSEPQYTPIPTPLSPVDDHSSKYNTQDNEKMSREARLSKEVTETIPHVKATAFPRKTEKNTNHWDERLVHSTRYVTGVAEGIRKLRSRLLLSNSGRKPKSILVLSSDPQEGKSFVCANLGISFARSLEYHATLVDCDLRRPSLHKMFGITDRKGLADYLNDEKDISSISSLAVDSGLPKLSIIPAGSIPDNPAELLSSEKMAEMFDELASRYQDHLVIVDSPPFHAAAETLLLSQLVDKIVLVVRWGKSGRENVGKMVETIGRDKIIGTVFNAFEMNILDRKIQGVGYHDYYSEYY